MAGMKLIATLIGRDASYGKTLKTAKANTIDFGRTLATVGTKMAALFAVRSVFQFGKQVADVTRTYEDSLARIGAISQATADEMMEIDSTLKRIGQTSRVTAREAASGMQFLVMAGLDANEAIAALQPTMNLAKGAGVSMAQSADMVTNLLSGLGLEADSTGQLVDVMAHAFRTANTDIPQFYAALKPMAPIINQLGLGVDDATVAINMLANAGIQGSEAGTALRMAISRLVRQPGEAAKALRQLGISIDETTIRHDGLIGTFEKLRDAGATTKQLASIFGRHFTRIGVLVNASADSLRAMEAEVSKNAGAADELYDAVSPLTRELDRFRATWEDTMLSMGKSGFNDAAAQGVSGLRSLLIKTKQWFKDYEDGSVRSLDMITLRWLNKLGIFVWEGIKGIGDLFGVFTQGFGNISSEGLSTWEKVQKSFELFVVSMSQEWGKVEQLAITAWNRIVIRTKSSWDAIKSVFNKGDVVAIWEDMHDQLELETYVHNQEMDNIEKTSSQKRLEINAKYLGMTLDEYRKYLDERSKTSKKSASELYEELKGQGSNRRNLTKEELETLKEAWRDYYNSLGKITIDGNARFLEEYNKLWDKIDTSTDYGKQKFANALQEWYRELSKLPSKQGLMDIDLSSLSDEEGLEDRLLSPYEKLGKKLEWLKTQQKLAWQVDPEQYKQATEGIAQIEAQMETFGEQTEDMTRKQKALFDVVRQTSQAFVGMGEAMGEQDFSKVREQLYSLVQQLIATAMAALLAKETVKFGLVGLLAAGAFGLAFLKGTMGKTREQSFAYGGVVQGNSRSGDKTLVRANAGEMILNQGQQQRLFNAMNGGMFGMMGMDWRIRGEDLVLSTSRANRTIKRRNG